MSLYACVALMAAISYTILQQVAAHAHADNVRAAQAAGGDRKGMVSMTAYAIAIIAPFFGQAGVIISGVCIAGVAVLWFLPDRRVERVVSAEAD